MARGTKVSRTIDSMSGDKSPSLRSFELSDIRLAQGQSRQGHCRNGRRRQRLAHVRHLERLHVRDVQAVTND
jgi:hypothetical protein